MQQFTKNTTGEGTGGMYNLLQIIIDLPLNNDVLSFTIPQIQKKTRLCSQSVSNNLGRLVKANLLLRQESSKRGQRGRVIVYVMESDKIDFARKYLFNDSSD